MKTTKTIEISKFNRYERSSNSEAVVKVDGQCVGYIEGVVEDQGSYFHAKWVIVSYDVDVDVNETNMRNSFKTRGEAVAYVRSLFA